MQVIVTCKPVTICTHHVVSLFKSHATIMIKLSLICDNNKEYINTSYAIATSIPKFVSS